MTSPCIDGVSGVRCVFDGELVLHRLCSVDLASDHGRASVFRPVHGMRSACASVISACGSPGLRLETALLQRRQKSAV
jgi:hypothetical protein